jgi:hypothetical protein
MFRQTASSDDRDNDQSLSAVAALSADSETPRGSLVVPV